jgi:hypothetical protein
MDSNLLSAFQVESFHPMTNLRRLNVENNKLVYLNKSGRGNREWIENIDIEIDFRVVLDAFDVSDIANWTRRRTQKIVLRLQEKD